MLLLVAVLAACGPEKRKDIDAETRTRIQDVRLLVQKYHAAKIAQRPALRAELLKYGGIGERALYAYLSAIFRHKRIAVADELLQWTRDEFVVVMGKTSNRGMIYLVLNLRNGDSTTRNWTIQVLERVRDSIVTVAEEGQPREDMVAHELIRKIYDQMTEEKGDVDYRFALLRAIAAMKGAQEELGLDRLHQELASSVWQIRGRLIETLGYLDSQESEDLLEQARRDRDPIIRRLAEQSVRRRAKRTNQAKSRKTPK